MKRYCDLTGEPECIGILPGPRTELILTGTQVHTEPEKLRDHPLAVRLAAECDLHFWFGGAPSAPFYTVPRSVVFAHDSLGGYFLTREHPALDWSEPVYYIDPEHRCFRLTKAGQTRADMGGRWREAMVPSVDFEVFRDRAAAQLRFAILDPKQLLEEER